MDTSNPQDEQPEQPVQPVQPTSLDEQPVEPTPQKSSAKKIGIVVGGLSMVVLILVAALITSNGNNKLNSDSQAGIKPTPHELMPTITPGAINSKEGLEKALSELDNANVKAENEIQGQINQLDAENSQ